MNADEKNIRSALKAALGGAPEEFSLRAFAASSEVPEEALEQFLDSDSEWFRDGDLVRSRESVFRGRKFLITPEAWEIESGILVPGHRFTPYLDPEVFPSEVIMRCGRSKVRTRETTLKMSQVIGCFPLLGTEQMLDVLAAESPKNGSLRSGMRSDSAVELAVFDLSDFYREHEFEEGDALLCEVADYRKGKIRCGFLSGMERSAARKKAFMGALEDACEKAIRRFGDYLDVPEELAWSFFFGGRELDEPGASLDEFIRESPRIVLAAGPDGHGELRCAAADADDDEAPTLPEGFSISSGETGTLPAMLKATKAAVTSDELDGFILDACATREMDFANFYARAFRGGGPDFADDAQEAVFMNAVEDRFEELTGHYDRVDDELKAPLRSSIMEAVEERLEFFSEAAAWDGGTERLDAEKLKRLAMAAGRLETLLRTLDREDFMPDAVEIERLEKQLEAYLDEQDAALEALRDGFSQQS